MSSLYIHIPFCRRKCAYCDFYSSVNPGQIRRFIQAMSLETMLYSAQMSSAEFTSLYLGGGTPSLLRPEQIRDIIRMIIQHVHFSREPEWSLEVNPGTVSREKLNTYIQLGFNRLNIGAQSFRKEELALLERIHGPEDIKKAVQMARSAGFQNIGLDLIFGLPGQSLKAWEASVKASLTLEPAHISVYALSWSDKTPLGRSILRGTLSVPDDERVSDLFLQTHDWLSEEGYIHYEISNYAKPGYECRHNWQYWNGTPYLGMGPSAHSFWNHQRWWNIADVDKYCRRLEKGVFPVEGSERLSEKELRRERIALGLRTILGIPVDDLTYKDNIKRLSAEGLGETQGNRWKLTPRGMLLADEIAVQLI